jgi:outer membrane protein assembly factor BamB
MPPVGGFPPPPPGPPTAVPGAPGGPARQKTTLIVVSAAVASVLALGTAGYFVFADGGGKDPAPPVAQGSTSPDAKPSAEADKGDGSGNGGPDEDLNSARKQGEDKVLWLKTSKVDGPGMGVESKGQWVVGDTVVKSVWKSLTGYSVTDGKEKWTLSLPAPVCSVTPQTTPDGKTVVMYRDGEGDTASCNQMRMIDLKAGKEGWSKEVPKEGAFDLFTDPDLSLDGDVVSVNRLTRATVFKVSTGDKLFTSPSEGCMPGAYLGGNGKMIAVATCHDGDLSKEIQDVDPATGKSTWSFRLPKGYRVNTVYSVDPIVIDIGDDTKKERAIVVLGPDGKKRTAVTGDGKFAVCTSDRALQGCGNGVVDSNTLYLPTSADVGSANEIVAFDLGTGKVKWRVPAGGKRTMIPLKAANGQLIAYRKAEYDQGGEILSIPAAGGNPTALLRHPSGPAAPVESSFYNPRVDYVDGRFFISAARLLAKGKDEKLLMVFGK